MSGRARAVRFTILAQEVSLAPYTIGDLYRALPALEVLNAVGELATKSMTATARAVLEFLEIGLTRAAAGWSADTLGDALNISEALALQASVREVLEVSGVKLVSGGPAIESSTGVTLEDQLDRTVMELVAAGIEGGSLSAIEDRWTLGDVNRLHAVWRERGPPVHVGVAVIAASLGNKLTRDVSTEKPDIIEGGIVGPSIAELAALMAVPPGHDTLEASRAIAERMSGTA